MVVKRLPWRSDFLNKSFKTLDRKMRKRNEMRGAPSPIPRQSGPVSTRQRPRNSFLEYKRLKFAVKQVDTDSDTE